MSMCRTPSGDSASIDGVDERGRAADVRALAHAFRAHRMVRARRHGVPRLPVRRLERGRHEVVREVGVQVVAFGVVLDLLDERHREAFGQSAVDLSFDDHRVDDDAAVVDCDEAAHLRLARVSIDVHDRHVRAVRVRHVRRIVVVGRLEPGLVLRHVRVGGKGHFLHRHRLGRHALHLELVVGPLDVALAHLEQVRGNLCAPSRECDARPSRWRRRRPACCGSRRCRGRTAPCRCRLPRP